MQCVSCVHGVAGKCGEPQPSDQADGSEKMASSEPEVGKRGVVVVVGFLCGSEK
jgi:hypothetical protein